MDTNSRDFNEVVAAGLNPRRLSKINTVVEEKMERLSHDTTFGILVDEIKTLEKKHGFTPKSRSSNCIDLLDLTSLTVYHKLQYIKEKALREYGLSSKINKPH